MSKLVVLFLSHRNDIFIGQLGTVGITEYAADMLGDVVFVELPSVDSYVTQGGTIAGPTSANGNLEELGAVESVKSASDIYAPLSGQVFEINEKLNSKPSLINKSAEDRGTNLAA